MNKAKRALNVFPRAIGKDIPLAGAPGFPETPATRLTKMF
jgi:hypothetical protein